MTGLAALVDNGFNDLQDGKNYSGQLQLERALTPTTGIAANMSLSREALKDPGYSTLGWRGGVSGWRDKGRMTFTASAEVGRLHADERLLLFPERREDKYARLSLGVSLRQLNYAGFAPVLRFSIERNRSSIAVYDYRRTRTRWASSEPSEPKLLMSAFHPLRTLRSSCRCQSDARRFQRLWASRGEVWRGP